MLHESTQQLIRKLAELTDAGALAWKESQDGAVRLETEGYLVEVLGAPATFRLLRGDGRELERADEADLAAVAWPDSSDTYATRMTSMASRANRIARGAEQAIATILSSLSASPKAAAEIPAPVATFGETESFARPTPAHEHVSQPQPPPAATALELAPSPAPPNLLVQGISARSTQMVEPAAPVDIQRALAATAPKPSPEPAPKPPPTGPDIYKPWR